jgi:hypothetical protein
MSFAQKYGNEGSEHFFFQKFQLNSLRNFHSSEMEVPYCRSGQILNYYFYYDLRHHWIKSQQSFNHKSKQIQYKHIYGEINVESENIKCYSAQAKQWTCMTA